jgi:hypothetical protein
MRYDYFIKGTYLDQTKLNNLYDERYDQFLRYLNI